MKFYKCDQCGDEFNSEDGMIEGHYEHTRKIKLYKTGWDVESKEYKVKKTIGLYKTVPVPPPNDVIVKKDLCPVCVKKLEKP
jgi:hypothetical protein